jgi:hypothetical protein
VLVLQVDPLMVAVFVVDAVPLLFAVPLGQTSLEPLQTSTANQTQTNKLERLFGKQTHHCTRVEHAQMWWRRRSYIVLLFPENSDHLAYQRLLVCISGLTPTEN